ncbi:guanylate kinase [Patescibacteria group bacterium]
MTVTNKGIIQELKQQDRKNMLVVLSGPTCSGKDAVMRELLKRNGNFTRLVTTNSRQKRKDEKEGVDYYFIKRQRFEELIAQDAFFEWVEYRGEYRGTQKKHVLGALKSGKDVVWRIDVRGVRNIYNKVKKEIPNSVFIFIAVTLPVLKERIKKRATESQKWASWSVNRATWELKQYKKFDYLIHNKEGRLNKTVNKVKMVIEAGRHRIK